VAWSLNLHHPYDPSNPIDSIEVAARAINNIIGGATVTGADGSPVVQPGLEGDSANCLRYTGSAALTSRKGFPSLCASPVTSPAGQAALVADIYNRLDPHPSFTDLDIEHDIYRKRGTMTAIAAPLLTRAVSRRT